MSSRLFLIQDISLTQEVAKVIHAAFGFPMPEVISPYRVKERIKNSRWDVYGYMLNDMLVGTITVDHDPPCIIDMNGEKSIEHLSVLPWQHGKGIGTILLNHVINELYPHDDFHLTARHENPARRLYRRMKFVDEKNSYYMVTKRR